MDGTYFLERGRKRPRIIDGTQVRILDPACEVVLDTLALERIPHPTISGRTIPQACGGLALDRHQNHVLSMKGHNDESIHVYNQSNSLLRRFGSELLEPIGLAVDPISGNIVVCDTHVNKIQIFSESGEWIHSFGEQGEGEGQMYLPYGVTIDKNGKIIVCDHRSGVQIFSKEGTFLKRVAQIPTDGHSYDTLSLPTNVLLDKEGNIWVLDVGGIFVYG